MLRALAFALIVAAGACSAVDDFSRFQFGGDGGTAGGTDMRVVPDGSTTPPDMSTPLPGFGEVCTVDCASGFTCIPIANGGGGKGATNICSRTCSTNNGTACGALGATCITVEGTTLCMPDCNLGKTCNAALTCCANKMSSIIGQCAPPNTDFCGKG